MGGGLATGNTGLLPVLFFLLIMHIELERNCDAVAENDDRRHAGVEFFVFSQTAGFLGESEKGPLSTLFMFVFGSRGTTIPRNSAAAAVA